MPNLNVVQLLGKVTWEPKLRELKNGNKVAELGLGISENFKNEQGEWSHRMHFVDVVLWNEQARFAVDQLHKGDGVLVQGALQFDQWESKDGGKRSKLRVKGQRVQPVMLPPSKAQSA
ncbi:single-stranded DNA-binding protein [Kiritimatiellaeota bacterium B1221]|nr:single-stranded DNA-binding protein [Kiritimatiellaeota bacterium B1221]